MRHSAKLLNIGGLSPFEPHKIGAYNRPHPPPPFIGTQSKSWCWVYRSS